MYLLFRNSLTEGGVRGWKQAKAKIELQFPLSKNVAVSNQRKLLGNTNNRVPTPSSKFWTGIDEINLSRKTFVFIDSYLFLYSKIFIPDLSTDNSLNKVISKLLTHNTLKNYFFSENNIIKLLLKQKKVFAPIKWQINMYKVQMFLSWDKGLTIATKSNISSCLYNGTLRWKNLVFCKIIS